VRGQAAFKGGGLDGEVQRFALSGLNGAACRCTRPARSSCSRSCPQPGRSGPLGSPDDRRRAAAGFDQAFKDTEERGIAGLVIGNILEAIIGEPLNFFLDVTD
jgi:hypothetical protein